MAILYSFVDIFEAQATEQPRRRFIAGGRMDFCDREELIVKEVTLRWIIRVAKRSKGLI